MNQYYLTSMLTPGQWRYVKFWIIVILLAEMLMLFLNERLPFLYCLIAAAFSCSLILRVIRVYPGKEEPLILDASAAGIALLWGFMARVADGSGWRFFLIFTSSMIILPHLIYIAGKRDIEY